MSATPTLPGRPPDQRPAGALALLPGCLGIVAVCGLLFYVVHGQLPPPPSGDPTVPRIFAALIGMIGGLGLSSAWSVLRGHGRGTGTRSGLHARAKSDAAPEDGQPIIATGVVRADRALTSPIGGVACAAYDFVMFTLQRHGRDQARNPVYWGYGSERFSIDSRSRSYPVAGAIHFTDASERPDGEAARARARAYVRSTGWETVEFGQLGAMDTILQRVGMIGIGTRKNFGQAFDTAPDVALLTLEERVLPIGATVSAFGHWSSAHGAIVAPPSPLPASFVVVARGGPEALDGAAGVPQSTTSYVVGAIVMIALAAGLYWLALLIIPTIHA